MDVSEGAEVGEGLEVDVSDCAAVGEEIVGEAVTGTKASCGLQKQRKSVRRHRKGEKSAYF